MIEDMIKTGRLIIRRWRARDLASLGDILGDPHVMAFSDHGALRQADRRAWLSAACAARPGDLLSGARAITQRADGRIIGYIRLAHDPGRMGPGDAELGTRLARCAWGKGYATEAATAFVDAARTQPAIKRVVAIVDPQNGPACRALDKLGMIASGEVMFDGYDHPDRLYVRELGLR